MGAWDIGIFDDDAAYDVFDELQGNDIKEYMKISFLTAQRAIIWMRALI